MCDLIDLDNSAGDSSNTKLASPLIPVPSNIKRKNINICDNKFNNNTLITEKRESLGDNPFDAILDEAIENVRKKEDPFETVYEKAFMGNNITAQEEKNINITDDLKATYTQLSEINSLDLSILNHSAMNDTLYESKCNEEEAEIPYVFQHKIPLNRKTVQSRSYSQGDIISECKQLIKPRSNSTTESLTTDKINTNDSDIKSFSVLNKGFIEDQYNDISVFSTISNISSITRNSGSITYNSASISNNTMNVAFLNKSCSSIACDTKLNERINNTMSTVPTISLPISPAQKPIKTTVDVNNKLLDDKLLDIDTCIPEITSSKLSNNSSDSSSDSIFVKKNNINTSIINEAIALARTFEEYAGKSSESNIDELIINDPMWTSELLPAYEDDVVDNLIEVPVLNATNREQKNGDMLSCSSNTNDITKSQNNVKKEMDIAPLNQITVNKTAASTLLVDLKKIVKTENNSEANRLLENLEQVLGIQSNNEIELFSTCDQTTNDSRAIQITKEENKHDSKNHVDDLKNNEIEVEESHYDNKINGCEALHDNNKSLIKENEVSSMNPRIEISPEKESSIEVEKKEINVDINNFTQKNVTINKEENNKTENNEKVAVELLINLGKVLSGQSNESATLNLLKNLGEVLNLVSKNDQEKINVISNNTEKIPIKDTSGNKVKSSTSLKVKQRRSLDVMSKEKPTYQKSFRRSTSTHNTSPPKKLQKSFVFKDNNKSQLSKTRKRFSSDPGSINLDSSKTEIAASIRDHPIISIGKINTNENNPKEKQPIKLVGKNQLKHKSKSEIVNKKGPMKAIIPIGNMQRKGTITPTKSPKNVQPCIKIFSSTPNSIESGIELKRSPKVKPMASSTPDFLKRKSVVQVPTLQRRDRLNASCDISPINVQEEVTTEKCKVYLSPRRANKGPSPKKSTPKSQKRESSIPKYSMSPGAHARTSSQDINKSQEISMSSQNLSRKEEDMFKKSPMIRKRIEKSERKSPLTDNNTNITKGKPFNLSSKFRGNNNENIESEKENTFV
ncbi:PREDICTED: bud site selection protein 4-like isoform X2 [Polistes dominula]|uniref:Bud site selection protein 4-like isoform X2 n=1 Tax=Polistes dominula TaxID=743375 RepID=A0ABM1HTP6_POLDO|nr:PREDICTED: bud site selection protein 4-like isoform X2 [Polistes dominula]